MHHRSRGHAHGAVRQRFWEVREAKCTEDTNHACLFGSTCVPAGRLSGACRPLLQKRADAGRAHNAHGRRVASAKILVFAPPPHSAGSFSSSAGSLSAQLVPSFENSSRTCLTMDTVAVVVAETTMTTMVPGKHRTLHMNVLRLTKWPSTQFHRGRFCA